MVFGLVVWPVPGRVGWRRWVDRRPRGPAVRAV